MAFANIYENVVITLTLIILIAHQGYSYRCYECNSHTYPGCADPLQKNYINVRECNVISHYADHPIGCLKEIKKTTDGIKISRRCLLKSEEQQYFSDATEPCAIPPYTNDFVCRCYGDLCNGAPKRATNYSLMILSAFLLLLTIRWQLLS